MSPLGHESSLDNYSHMIVLPLEPRRSHASITRWGLTWGLPCLVGIVCELIQASLSLIVGAPQLGPSQSLLLQKP